MYDSKTKQGDKPGSFSKGSVSHETKTVDQDPDAKKSGKSARIQTNHRFPDLIKKPVWREKLEAMPKSDVFLMKKDGSLEQVAFGEGHGQSEATGVDVLVGGTSDENESNTRLPRFVRRGLKMIADLPEFAEKKPELKLVCLPGKSQPIFDLPVVVDEDGEIERRLLFTLLSGRTRQLKACAAVGKSGRKEVSVYVILEGSNTTCGPKVSIMENLSLSEAIVKLLAFAPAGGGI